MKFCSLREISRILQTQNTKSNLTQIYLGGVKRNNNFGKFF